jgi:Polyketide cyclase / dehydrase and lipid transport
MRALLWVAAALLALSVIVVVIGLLLPRDHVASRTVTLPAPPERVWALISDVEHTARWRPDISKIERVPGSSPVRYIETASYGATTYDLVRQTPPSEQIARVVDTGQPFGGEWRWQLAPAGSGTQLIITETGFITNPLFRVMSKLFFPPTRTMDAYLNHLANALRDGAGPLR